MSGWVQRSISSLLTPLLIPSVGLGKIEYLKDELGEGTVELMQTLKRTLDPYDLLNPGKLYPDIKPEQRP